MNAKQMLEQIKDTMNNEIDSLINELPEDKHNDHSEAGTFKMTLAQARQIAQAGLARTVFKVGDFIVSPYKNGEIVWIVVGVGLYSIKLHMRDTLKGGHVFGEDNDWENSDIRKWLNDAENGFMSGFTKEDAAAMAPTRIITEKKGKDNTTVDKLYLLSRKEVGLGNEGDVSEGEALPYYDSDEKRRKVDEEGNNRYWWLRSPDSGDANHVRRVDSSGALDSDGACYRLGVAAACTIR